MPKSDSRTLRERILHLLQQPDYQPLDKVDLSKALRIGADDRRHVRDELREMEQSGQIVHLSKGRYALPAAENFVTGRLEIHRGGSAHVVNEKRDGPDLFIAQAHMGTAMHGDTVVARISRKKGREPQKESDSLEGRIERVLKRVNDTVVGTVQSARDVLRVVPDDARFPHDVYLRPPKTEAPAKRRNREGREVNEEAPPALPRPPRPGDKVVVRLAPWEDAREAPEGDIIEILGPAHAPGVDMLSVIRKYNLPAEFPEAVTREAERVSETVDPREIERREDLREEFILTIDPDDAKDFDDAIHVHRLTGKHGEPAGWRLGVHIADVSHYVRIGTALDKEASRRGNSTYLADRVIPMLPERLSNGICSLKPQVERLTFSAFVDFDKAGRIKSARFAKTVIRSAARLSYRQALAILEGKKEMPPLPPAMTREARGQATLAEGPPVPVDPRVAEAVRTAWELASLLRRNRFEAGSLDLDFPEVKVWLDGEGRAVKLERIENDISHQLIEECMLVANEVVAREVKNRQAPSVYRIHEDPDPDKLAEFREVAATHGFRVGDLTQREEIQKLLAMIRGTTEEPALKLQFLKSLKRAMYAVQPLGHYGLAKVNYTHFTSPIRRYADLVVHRSLEGILARGSQRGVREERGHSQEGRTRRTDAPTSIGALTETAEHISTTERNSSDAERDSVMLKKMEFFQRQLTSRTPQEFRAFVADVRSYGMFAELPDAGVSGLIHVSDLPEDYYVFDPVRLSFTGRRTRRVYRAGEELTVIVSRVDAYKRQIDFVPVVERAAKGGHGEGESRGPSGKPRSDGLADPSQQPRGRGGRGAPDAQRRGQGNRRSDRGASAPRERGQSAPDAPRGRRDERRSEPDAKRGLLAERRGRQGAPDAKRHQRGAQPESRGGRGAPETKRGEHAGSRVRPDERGPRPAKRGTLGENREAAARPARGNPRGHGDSPKPAQERSKKRRALEPIEWSPGQGAGQKPGRSTRGGGSGRRRGKGSGAKPPSSR